MLDLVRCQKVVEWMLGDGRSLAEVEDYIEASALEDMQKAALWMLAWAHQEPAIQLRLAKETLALASGAAHEELSDGRVSPCPPPFHKKWRRAIARRALHPAADVENLDWARPLRRVANALPERRPFPRLPTAPPSQAPADALSVMRQLRDLPIPPRARNALVDRGLDLDAIKRMSDDELLGIEGIGPVTVKLIRDSVNKP